MRKKEPSIVVSFRTSPDINDLAEILAKKNGQSKSEFISLNTIDTAMKFERTRQIDTLADFLDLALPYLTQGMEKEQASQFIERLSTLQRNYIKQRLDSKMGIQRHLTNIAIRSYLQDYTEDFEGVDGFIIQQCLKTIYDRLFELQIIPREEWEAKTHHYDLYMQEEGLKLLKME